MKKFFYTVVILVEILLLLLFIYPEKISQLEKKARKTAGEIVVKMMPMYKKIKSPFLELCFFQKSKLACLLTEGEDVPINSSCFIDDSLLKSKILKGLPKWAKMQIEEDLSKFSDIREADLEKYFQENTNSDNILIRVEIKNKKVKTTYANHQKPIHNTMGYVYGEGVVRHVLSYLAEKKYISDTVFILSLADFYTPTRNESIPVFTFCKDLNIPIEKDLILIPDWQNLGSIKNLMGRIKATRELILWEDKKDMLFWRGGEADSTGFRHKFISFAKKNKGLINAEFFNAYQKSTRSGFVSPEKHLEYKYLISIDGYRGSWERLIWHLHSNSLVFKHESNQVQWYYKGIKPFLDYVPVTDEGSIIKGIRWAELHPKEVQAMIHHASSFVDENLTLEDMYHYIIILLQEYNKKLTNRFEVKVIN